MRTLPEKIDRTLEQPGPIEQAVEPVTKAKSVLLWEEVFSAGCLKGLSN